MTNNSEVFIVTIAKKSYVAFKLQLLPLLFSLFFFFKILDWKAIILKYDIEIWTMWTIFRN